MAVSPLSSGRWAVMLGLEFYRAIFPTICRNGYDIFTQRARASGSDKLGIAVRAFELMQ
jgi:hypothetical protein